MGVEFRLGQEVKSIQLESDTVKLSILDLTSDNQVGEFFLFDPCRQRGGQNKTFNFLIGKLPYEAWNEIER